MCECILLCLKLTSASLSIYLSTYRLLRAYFTIRLSTYLLYPLPTLYARPCQVPNPYQNLVPMQSLALDLAAEICAAGLNWIIYGDDAPGWGEQIYQGAAPTEAGGGGGGGGGGGRGEGRRSSSSSSKSNGDSGSGSIEDLAAQVWNNSSPMRIKRKRRVALASSSAGGNRSAQKSRGNGRGGSDHGSRDVGETEADMRRRIIAFLRDRVSESSLSLIRIFLSEFAMQTNTQTNKRTN